MTRLQSHEMTSWGAQMPSSWGAVSSGAAVIWIGLSLPRMCI